MRAGLLIETFTHLGLAVSTTPWTAMPIFFVFGIHEAVWGTVATTVRQRAVPTRFQGRVGAVYYTGVFGGLVIGAAAGGVIAQRFGVTGPFWFAFVGSACILVWIWRRGARPHRARRRTHPRARGGRRTPTPVTMDPTTMDPTRTAPTNDGSGETRSGVRSCDDPRLRRG